MPRRRLLTGILISSGALRVGLPRVLRLHRVRHDVQGSPNRGRRAVKRAQVPRERWETWCCRLPVTCREVLFSKRGGFFVVLLMPHQYSRQLFRFLPV